MTRTIYFTACTLDGFIATSDHSLDWLLTRDQDEDHPMAYNQFFGGVGAMAMGASTYQWVEDHYGHEPWMYDIPCWVFTHRDYRRSDDADVRFTRADVGEVHAEMAAVAGSRNIWLVGGGDLVGQFADRGLLDEVHVHFAPVTIGAGAPLLPRHVELRLEELAHNREFACTRYSVVRTES